MQCVPNRIITSKGPIYTMCHWRLPMATLHKRLSDEYPSMTAKLVRELGIEPSWPQSQCGALPNMLLSEKCEKFLLDYLQPDPLFSAHLIELHRRKNGEKTHRTQNCLSVRP